MAVIQPQEISSTSSGSGLATGYRIIKWTPVTEADSCQSAACGGYANKSIHVTGTFGSTTVTVQGSNEPMTVTDANATFAGLRNSTHTAISMTATAVEEILENTVRIRPVLTSGSGVSVTVWLLIQTSARR